MSSEANRALVRRVFEQLDQHNFAILDEVLVADYRHHDPALPPEMQQGRDKYREGTAMMYGAFPDLTGTIEEQCAEGDTVTTRLTWHGTHHGVLMGIPASGNPVNFTMIVIHHFVNGKVIDGWVNFDALAMLQQVGAIPTHAPA
ncbi:MAG: ester cyclase [Herpetosiphon sp.]